MARRGWLGRQDRAGLLQAREGGEGEKEILTLDVNTMEYRARQKARFASLEAAKGDRGHGERLRALIGPVMEGQKGDKAQQFLWGALSETCLYAARRVPEISDHVADVDRAMRWGFGWELGPFEVMDAIGVKAFAAQVQKEGRSLPPVVEKLLASGRKRLLRIGEGRDDGLRFCQAARRERSKSRSGVLILKSLKDAGREVERNSGASLIDLGDGVVCCEFHSKMNAIGADLIAMIHKGLKRLETRFRRDGDCEPGREFFGRRKPDAGAGGRAGAGVGRTAPGGEAISERESGDQVRAEAGGDRAARNGARRRLRSQPARRENSGRGGSVHGAGGSGRRIDPGRRRIERNADSRERACGRRRRSGFVSRAEAGVRNDRDGESRNERGRMPRPGIPAARRRRLDEPRSRCRRRERSGAGAVARRIQGAGGKLAGRRADHADQSARRTVSRRRRRWRFT